MKVVKYCVLVLVLITSTTGFMEGQEEKYVIHIQYGPGLDTSAIYSILDTELENTLIKTGKYKHSSRDLIPTIKVIINIQSKGIDPKQRESQTTDSAISVAYIFFPNSINYYAYSNCSLIKDESNLRLLAKAIDIELRSVYNRYYDKALDMHKSFAQYMKTQDKK